MIKKLKTIMASALALTVLAAPLALAPSASAQNENVIEGGICQGGDQLAFEGERSVGDCSNVEGSEEQLNTLIGNIINIFSVVVGIVAVVMIIVGGFRYITSGGDSGNVTGAKNTILYAIVGLVIVALAQFIVRFVLNQSAGITG
mgnify:CR=1 FL=1